MGFGTLRPERGSDAGTNPATGTARYYFHDHLGSTRRVYSATRTLLGTYRFTPYGSVQSQSGAALDTLGGAFTGKPWDSAAQLYYFPYRYYSPTMARWTSRDPLGMVDGPNMFGDDGFDRSVNPLAFWFRFTPLVLNVAGIVGPAPALGGGVLNEPGHSGAGKQCTLAGPMPSLV